MDAAARRGPASDAETGRPCPYCRFPLKQGVEVVQCAHCGASHHADCWDDNIGCAVVACEGGPKAAAAAAPPSGQPVPPPVQRGARLTVDPADFGAPPPTGQPLPPPPPAVPGTQRAGELVASLTAGLGAPAVVFAVVAGVIGALLTLGAALIVAVATPDDSALGIAWLGNQAGTGTETFRVATAFLQAGFDYDVASPMPLLFVGFPLLGCATGAYTQRHRIQGMRPLQQLFWGAATGIPFALLMLLVSTGVGDVGADGAAVFWLGLLWGALGGLLGARRGLRRDPQHAGSPSVLPPGIARWAAGIGAALRPLLVLILILGAVGSAAWIVQDLREAPGAVHFAELEGTTPPKDEAVIDDVLYAVEHGVRFAELGAGAQFVVAYPASGPPVPVDRLDKLYEDQIDDNGEGASELHFRIFGFGSAMEPYVFVPMLIVLIGAVVFFALFAGFSTARAVGARDANQGAIAGAGVGVVWAAAMVAAEALARIFFDYFGRADGDNVFLMFLLVGGTFGALGGYIAVRQAQPAPVPAPVPEAIQ